MPENSMKRSPNEIKIDLDVFVFIAVLDSVFPYASFLNKVWVGKWQCVLCVVSVINVVKSL